MTFKLLSTVYSVAKQHISSTLYGSETSDDPQSMSQELEEFVNNLTPETFKGFPQRNTFKVASEMNAYELTEWQLRHCLIATERCPSLATLRRRLVPQYMDDLTFWQIYFTVISNFLNRLSKESTFAQSERVLQSPTKIQSSPSPKESFRNTRDTEEETVDSDGEDAEFDDYLNRVLAEANSHSGNETEEAEDAEEDEDIDEDEVDIEDSEGQDSEEEEEEEEDERKAEGGQKEEEAEENAENGVENEKGEEKESENIVGELMGKGKKAETDNI
ncbi:hypothetical protein CYMTET_52586 [Cymbomonas tetramitiformis]|uniref:BSD domain-containing protein n=1 Tax=Cymbomonas tetramitiformis TaxID=36881 RepID=A0AAE0BJV7_9CHLO|nr:hypothetical protein CYMTET_52586 [Cymbomonas tetramitiformis]|eukprot:gene12219-14430_t